ncbi:MAG TPA: FecR domain-containing protein [Candidatus Sulfotelmatobacter sp.]|nr:FecR domain-containing protein [Candidatus Sulfotelmatobacter sp.]
MKLARWRAVATSCFLAALLSVPAWAADTNNTQRMAMPGTLNYVEGQASIGDQNLSSNEVGTANLQNGQVLETGDGKAEVLLTPGVYLRVGSNSAVKMVSDNLADTQVALQQGEAMLEVDQLYKENNIHITQPGADTRVLKTGLYDFDATDQQVRVFDGKASVAADDHTVTVKKDHELALNSPKLKSEGFDKKEVANNDLYRWSSLRSQYLSEANIDAAQRYYGNGGFGPGWWGAGWYWDPWFDGFTFLPADGFFYNPFGWGFYSPVMVWRAPYYGGVVGYRHFDGNRPVAIGHGFHSHAVTRYGGNMGGFRGARVGGGGHFGGFRGGRGGSGGGFHGGGVHR